MSVIKQKGRNPNCLGGKREFEYKKSSRLSAMSFLRSLNKMERTCSWWELMRGEGLSIEILQRVSEVDTGYKKGGNTRLCKACNRNIY